MTTRKRWSAKQRMEILNAEEGKCYICKQVISRDQGFELEHVLALGIGGADSHLNLRPVCRKCHRIKTRDDMGKIAKCRRQEQKSWGARTSKGRKLQSRGFDKSHKPAIELTKVIPRKQLYKESR